MPIYQAALARILPPGAPVYVALLVTPPDLLGAGEVEPTYTGYARIAHSGWTTSSDSQGRFVANNSSLAFVAVVGSAITIYGWGIYLTAVGGSLLAGGLINNIVGVVQPQYLAVGDQARFLTGALKIRGGT